MSRLSNERRANRNTTVVQRPAGTLPSRQERRLELEARLRIQEMDAHLRIENLRWQRRKDMILVGTLACVALGSFTVWAVVLLSGAYPSAEKQLITGFIVQLFINLFLVVAGKKVNWKEGSP